MFELPAMDTNQVFLDWSLPATLEERRETFDPVTGETETVERTVSVHIICGPNEFHRNENTIGNRQEATCSFLILAEQIPSDFIWSDSQLVLHEESLRIDSVECSSISGMMMLNCHRQNS